MRKANSHFSVAQDRLCYETNLAAAYSNAVKWVQNQKYFFGEEEGTALQNRRVNSRLCIIHEKLVFQVIFFFITLALHLKM